MKSYIRVSCQKQVQGSMRTYEFREGSPSPNASSEKHRHNCYELFVRLRKPKMPPLAEGAKCFSNAAFPCARKDLCPSSRGLIHINCLWA